MLQKIIFTIFIINTLNTFSDGIPQSEFNETKLLLSMSSQLTELRSQQEHQRQLIDGVIKTLEMQDHQEKLSTELVKANIQILKADLEQQGKLIDSHEKSFEIFVNKSDFQSLVEELDRQKVDGITKATEIKSELQRFEKFRDVLVKKSYPSCTEAKTSGIFDIRLFNFSVLPFKVFCDAETHDGGWTTILRRIDGSVDFYRNWTEYKNGFGNLSGEFFLGLDKIHAITSDRNQELLVILEDFEGDERFETYDEFAIGDENQKYILHTLGKANGTAGDSLTNPHRGMKFTTFDNDNDGSGGNCAEQYTSAWWYRNCHNSNLMGRYKENSLGKGVVWHKFRGQEYSLKKAIMLIRPKN